MREHQWDFFIAHAGYDTAPAEALYGMLAGNSRVFLDSRCLLLGDDWDDELVRAQRTSLMTIVLVSTRTENAFYQREEIAAAIKFARSQEHNHRVVPVYLDADSQADPPYGLLRKHGITLSRETSLADVAQTLLRLLSRLGQRTQSQNKASLEVDLIKQKHRYDRYGKQLLELVEDGGGLLTEIDRSLLRVLSDDLAISADEASSIEAEVLTAWRANLKKYEDAARIAILHRDPIDTILFRQKEDKDQQKLKKLQTLLQVSDKGVERIHDTLAIYRRKLERYREELQKFFEDSRPRAAKTATLSDVSPVKTLTQLQRQLGLSDEDVAVLLEQHTNYRFTTPRKFMMVVEKVLALRWREAIDAGVRYGFRLSGSAGGEWTIDLRNLRVLDEIVDVDVYVEMSDENFVALLESKLDALAAFHDGRIKVDGDRSKLVQLGKIMRAILPEDISRHEADLQAL